MQPPGTPNITEQLLKGVKLGDRTYKNHLDGYNQMDLITGKGPSKRQEIFYFAGAGSAMCESTISNSSSFSSLGLARTEDHNRHADDGQLSSGSVRTHSAIHGESPNASSFGYGMISSLVNSGVSSWSSSMSENWL